jgi:cytochrome b561
MNDRTQEVIAAATADGWQIVSRDAGGIQFRKPKQWQKGAVVLGLLLLLFWGLGLLVLLVAVLDYAIAKDKLAYLTSEQLAAGTPVSAPAAPAATLRGTAMTLVYVLVGLVVVTVAIGLLMWLAGS